MDAPSVTYVKDTTNLEALKGASVPIVEETLAQAISSFKRFTGLAFATVPTDDEPLVRRAVRGLTELHFTQDSAEYMETLADWDLIQSFTAGSYSETHRSAEDAMKARLLVAWPWLSSLLWDLMTDEKRDHFDELFGAKVPAFGVQEVDWGQGSRLAPIFTDPNFPGV